MASCETSNHFNKMKSMGHHSAACRTRSGFIRVQKGRSYMKPPLGDYHSNSDRNPAHCYSRQDFTDRLMYQPAVPGDIASLKRQGHVMPNMDEVIFNEQFVAQPWAYPMEYPTNQKKRKKKPKTAPNLEKSKNENKYSTEYYIPSTFRPLTPAVKWQSQIKCEFRQAIMRMGCPAVFAEYLNKTKPKTSYQIRKTRKQEQYDLGSDIEEDILTRAKSVVFSKSFKASKVPWKSFLQPNSIKDITTMTTSQDKLSQDEFTSSLTQSEDSDSSASDVLW